LTYRLMADHPPVSPVAIRSRVILEMACELVAMDDQSMRQAKVLLRAQGAADQTDWPLRLFGSSTGEGVDAVVSGESAIAIINPSGALAVAYRGSATRPPAPVRTIAVIPSPVHPKTGLTRFEEILGRRVPLRVSLRGQRDHCLHSSWTTCFAPRAFRWPICSRGVAP
jgi:hypothetical protein